MNEVADNVRIPALSTIVSLLIRNQVNKSVGRGLASTIEKGEEATESTKETLGTIVLGEHFDALLTSLSGAASAKTQETASVAGQKANQVRFFASFVHVQRLMFLSRLRLERAKERKISRQT